MHKIPVIAVIILLVLVCQPTHADVTVTMRGSFAVNGDIKPSQTTVDRMNLLLNSTQYYRGESERIDFGNYSVIARDNRPAAILIDLSTRRYRAFNINSINIASAVKQLLTKVDPDVSLSIVSNRMTTIKFDGHRCHRYITQFTVSFPSQATGAGYTFDEIYAIDFPGIGRTRQSLNGSKVRGVYLRGTMLTTSPYFGMTVQTQAVGISTQAIAAETFGLSDDYTKSNKPSSLSFDSVGKGVMSAKPTDPYINLNQFTGADKAQKLITAGKFDDAGDLVRSLAKRNLNGKLGPIYNLLGDHSISMNKRDEAWGWYSLAVTTSDEPADLIHAHFALADYYTANRDIDHATKQLQAILDLPTATQTDKDKAADLMKSLTLTR